MRGRNLVAGILAGVMALSLAVSDGYAADSEAAGRAGTVSEADIWSAPTTVKVLSTKEASEYADVRESEITITAAKNEYESGQIIVSAKNDLSFTVSLSDLVDVNNENNVISKDNFAVYTQKYITVTENRYGNGAPTGDYPDAILPQENAVAYGQNKVKKGMNGGAWLEFYIPEDTVAGTYRGEATVSVGGAAQTIPVSMKVYDVTIPAESSQKSLFHVNQQQVLDHEGDSSWEMMEKYYDFLLKYRCSPTDITNGCSISPTEYADKAYALCQNGMSTVGVPSSVNQVLLDGFWVFEYELVAEEIVALARKSLETNYNMVEKAAFYNFYIDEPFFAEYADGQVAASIKAFDLAIAKAVSALERDPEFTGDFAETLLADIYNIANVITDYNTDDYGNSHRMRDPLKNADGSLFTYAGTSASVCAKPDAYGSQAERDTYRTDRELWWYNCNEPKYPYPTYHIDDTMTGTIAMEWMMAEYDIVGNLYWVTNLHTNFTTGENLEDPYGTAQRGSGANGDGVLLYPGKPYGVDGPVASIRLDAIRDGYEDYELIRMIKEQCGALGTDCTDIIKSIREKIYQESSVIGGSAEYETARGELLKLAEQLCSPAKKVSGFVEEGAWSGSEGSVYQEKINAIYTYDIYTDTFKKTSYGQDEQDVALLYADGKYQDFTMELDVTLNTENAADTLVWFVFGKQDLYKRTYTAVAEEDGTTVIRFTNGGKDDQGYHACKWETDWHNWRWGYTHRNFDLSQKHHARLTVADGTYSLWMDDNLIIDRFELPENYRAGYVGIGYGRADIAVANIRIISGEAKTPETGYPKAEGKVFAGWYRDAELQEPVRSSNELKEGSVYEKFVDERTLTVKCQLSAGTTASSTGTNLRLLTTVDSLYYRSVGFDIEVNGRTQSVTSTSVYPTIYGYTKSGGIRYTPSEAFACEDSKYFMAFKLTGIPNSAFATPIRVTPKWITLDGTVVTGTARTIVIQDIVRQHVYMWNSFGSEACAKVWSWEGAQKTWLENYEDANGVMKVELKYPYTNSQGEQEAPTKYVGATGGVNWPSEGHRAEDYQGAVGLVFRIKIEGKASNALTILGAQGQELGKVFDNQRATDGWKEFFWSVDVEKEYENLNKMSWIFWVNDNSTIYLDEIRAVYQWETWNGFDSADCADVWGWESAQRTWLESYEGAKGVLKVDMKYPYTNSQGEAEGNTKYVGAIGGVNWPSAGQMADDYHGAVGLAFRVKIEGDASNALTILGAQGQVLGKVFDNQRATDGWQEFVWKIDVKEEYEDLNKMSWIFWVNGNSTIYIDEIRAVYANE